MQSSHAAAAVDIAFDDPNLIGDGGLGPVVALAEKVGVPALVTDRVKITGADNSGGANAGAKVMTLLAAMIAGADSIDDTDRLRLGGTGIAFSEVRAPSTLGTFLRSFTHGHVKQLHAVHKQVLTDLARSTALLPGADVLAFVDVDSTHRQVYGYTKQGAENGRLKGKKTLHPLIAGLSTPLAAPVIAGIRMRKGKAADVRGAAGFVAEALNTARAAGCTGVLVLRGDSKFYTADVVAAAGRAGAFVSLSTGSNPSVSAAIASIPEQGWTPIHYPDAFVDEDTGELVSDAEVAEIGYTAFTGRAKALHAPGRLIVRRVRRLNRTADAQGELFDVYRHHAVFTTSPFTLLQAESQHRAHAIVEQIIADAKASALAHLPSASFQANAAWATLWAIAHNLTRTAGVLTDAFHARATTTTIRAHLINIPARLARSARRLTIHLPQNWPWQTGFENLHTALQHWPPRTA
jgi:Transposase DDE domain group 1